jgi:hypothetical protein
MDPLLLGTATAFGLAASAGLNTTLPLLIVGLLARFGLLGLTAPFDALASDVALGGLILLAALEIVSDKVPGVDSVVHAIQWPLAAAAGAILFASQTSVVSWVSPGLAILVGLLTASAVHGARAVARPLVTGTSFGVGNPIVSAIEDGFALLLASASIAWPAIGLVLLILLAFAMGIVTTWALRRALRLRTGLRTGFAGRGE